VYVVVPATFWKKRKRFAFLFPTMEILGAWI